jgi:hypothetical protein
MKNLGVFAVAVLAYLGYGAVTSADRDSSGSIVGGGNIDAFHMQVGDCFNDASSYDEEIMNLPGVPCSEPHDNEAFAVFDVSMSTYPGDDMGEVAFDACMQHFERFVGNDYQSSELDIMTLYPTTTSWQQNDREVVCALYDMDANKLRGSVKGKAL